jgi:uncharacterized protein (TIGR02001 family)
MAGEHSLHVWSANVALTTDYLYRGVTQTNEGPAIQGSFDYAYTPYGFYLGIWGSNVEFNIAAPALSGGVPVETQTDDASLEIDFYGGFNGTFANGVSWDIGVLYYFYPGQDEDSGGGDYDFIEGYLNLGYTFVKVPLEPAVGFGFAYSADFFGGDGDSVYPQGSLALSLPEGFGLSLTVAHLSVGGDETTGPAGFSYTHWSVALSRRLLGLDLGVAYHDADDDCADEFIGDGDLCDAFLLTVSRSF